MFFTGSRYIVAGVTLLIAYIAITSQLFVFVPWLRTISTTRMLQVLGPFNLGVALIYWNYYLACTTEPGSPPPGWGVNIATTIAVSFAAGLFLLCVNGYN
jgi:hypothetical protein